MKRLFKHLGGWVILIILFCQPLQAQKVLYRDTVTGKRWWLIADLLPVSVPATSALSGKQPLNAKLTAISALPNAAGYMYNDGSGNFVYQTPSGSGDMSKSENLSGLSNYTTARANLGLGSLATQSATITDYLTTADAASTYALTGHNHDGSYSAINHNHTGVYQPVGSYLVAADIAGKANIAAPAFTGAVTTTGSIGYASGAGGTVTQATNKSTGVTLNKTAGQITMNGAALAAGAEVAFTLTNNTITATDVVIVNVQSVGTAGSYLVSVGAVSNGSCSITVSNASTGSLSQAIVLNFAVIKSVNN